MTSISEFMTHLKTLAEHIGPRGSATPAEEAAGEYVVEQLRSFGLDCQRQHFPAASTFSWIYILLLLTAPLAASLFLYLPLPAFLLAAAGAFGYLLEASTFPKISRLLPRRRSVNVIGKAHARSKEIRRLLVVAHLDSSRSALSFSPGMVGSFRQTTLLTFGALAALAVLYGLAVFLPALPRLVVWFISLALVAVDLPALILLIHRELKGRLTPGANDNASGVAVLLETARVIARAPLLTTSVWFVATGAEESGLWGALHLIRESQFDGAKTMVINLDNLGRGRLSLTTAEGMIFPLRSGAPLIEAARETAEEKGIDLALRRYHLLTNDSTAFMARRIPAATVMAFDERGLLPNWHWPTDTVERVDEGNLIGARDLVLGMIRRLGD